MDKKEIIKYIFLLGGILVFAVLIISLLRNNRTAPQEEIAESIPKPTTEEVTSVSEIFERNDDFEGGDPFSVQCSGREGAITSFTVCAGD